MNNFNNDTKPMPPPSFHAVYLQIEANCRRFADRVALEFEDNSVSYAALDHLASRYAAAMLSLGAKANQPVAVCIRNSERLPIFIFAIHRIGAIYLPIDPEFPPNRIDSILQEAKPALSLFESDSITDFTALNSVSWSEFESTMSADFTALQTAHRSDDEIADQDSHIFFTSGTTGKPKGVVATHANLSYYVHSAIERYDFGPGDRFVAAARSTFSISLFELIVPLAAGATLRILDRQRVLDMPYLTAQLAQANCFHIGPALLKQVLEYTERAEFPEDYFDSVRHASSGGDHVPIQVLEGLLNRFRKAEVFVIYGSSEISCMGCTYAVPREFPVSKTCVGKPFESTRFLLLDEQGRESAVGEPGTLYFSGPGLVRAYLNQPELTDAKFSEIDGQRFYCIGDVGRLDDDGDLILLGRQDYQIKINGIRIEPSEIEYFLKRHPLIADALVVGKPLYRHEQALVAYVVTREPLYVETLVSYLRENLPDNYIPARFVALEKLPLNFNGKLDRSSLPFPDNAICLQQAPSAAASSNSESLVRDIFADIFECEDIGLDSNFFFMGGDSLLAVDFMTRVRERTQLPIEIATIFRYPTVQELAKIIDATRLGQVSDNPIVPLNNAQTGPILFCLYGIFVYRYLGAAFSLNTRVVSVHIPDEIDILSGVENTQEFRAFTDFEALVEKYTKQICAYQPQGPYHLCGESFGGVLAMEVARRLQALGHAVNFVGMLDTWGPNYHAKPNFWQKIRIHLKSLRAYGVKYPRDLVLGKVARARAKINKRNTPVQVEKRELRGDELRKYSRELAIKTYEPSMFPGEVSLYKARERKPSEPDTRGLGWEPYIGNLNVHSVPGNHLTILVDPNVGHIARSIEQKMLVAAGASNLTK